MALLIKDSNQTVQSLSTEVDAQANLVPLHALANTVAGISTPVGPTTPLPVINTAGAAAVLDTFSPPYPDAQILLFDGTTPVNGFQVLNYSGHDMWVNDAGPAAPGSGFLIDGINVTAYTTPPGYRPIGPVSIYSLVFIAVFSAYKW